MCYESLRDDEATERPLSTLLRAELDDALVNGAAAAAIVVAVLFGRGADPASTALAAGGAFVLGATLHQAVLGAGAGFLRFRQGSTPADPARLDRTDA